MATVKLLCIPHVFTLYIDAGVSNDRVVVVSSCAAAVFLCTCILLMVFLVKWNSSRGWLSHSQIMSGNEVEWSDSDLCSIHLPCCTVDTAWLVIRLHMLE